VLWCAVLAAQHSINIFRCKSEIRHRYAMFCSTSQKASMSRCQITLSFSFQKIAIAQLTHLQKAGVLRSNPGSQNGRSNYIVAFLKRALARARTTVNAVREIGHDVYQILS
jgi:hypothetical protein